MKAQIEFYVQNDSQSMSYAMLMQHFHLMILFDLTLALTLLSITLILKCYRLRSLRSLWQVLYSPLPLLPSWLTIRLIKGRFWPLAGRWSGAYLRRDIKTCLPLCAKVFLPHGQRRYKPRKSVTTAGRTFLLFSKRQASASAPVRNYACIRLLFVVWIIGCIIGWQMS